MANPLDPGTFDYWITDRISFQDAPPASGDTGDFEKWLWDRGYWEDYVESTAEVRIPRPPAAYNTLAIY
ncbi:MAG: hypothetical protein PVJ86_00070 [Phycisphaerales bacterium]|jgi:hypothetical protein